MICPAQVILMAGLQGVGKTTACGKLALALQKRNKRVLMVATDVYRPAAIDQLVKLGERIKVLVRSVLRIDEMPRCEAGPLQTAKCRLLSAEDEACNDCTWHSAVGAKCLAFQAAAIHSSFVKKKALCSYTILQALHVSAGACF